jgi:hypothetical protein
MTQKKTIKTKEFTPTWILIQKPFSIEYGFIGGAIIKIASHLLFNRDTLLQLSKPQRKQLVKDLQNL